MNTDLFAPVPLDVWQIATFIALLAAVIALWIGPRFWQSCLGAATICGYLAGVLHGPAIVWIVLAWLLCGVHARAAVDRDSNIRYALTAPSVIVMMLLLGMHLLPGFNNPIVLDRVVLTPDSEPFTLYLNFDKTLAGLLLLGVCYPQWRGVAGLRQAFGMRPSILLAANVLVSITAAFLLGYVRFDPKWTAFFWPIFLLWATANLFSTCLSEEAFFRGFVQRELQTAWGSVRFGSWLALASGAFLFGVAHFAGGWRYVLLSTLAGAGYGYVYRRTRRIEYAMLAHFALNATHFLLFTYPRLAR